MISLYSPINSLFFINFNFFSSKFNITVISSLIFLCFLFILSESDSESEFENDSSSDEIDFLIDFFFFLSESVDFLSFIFFLGFDFFLLYFSESDD